MSQEFSYTHCDTLGQRDITNVLGAAKVGKKREKQKRMVVLLDVNVDQIQ